MSVTPIEDILLIRNRHDHGEFWAIARGWTTFEQASRITPDKERWMPLPPYGEWIGLARAMAQLPQGRENNGEPQAITPS